MGTTTGNTHAETSVTARLESELGTVEIAGLPIARNTASEIVSRVFADLGRGSGGWLVTANLDFVQRASDNPDMQQLYARADVVTADGAPLVWAARLSGHPVPERVAGSDLVWLLAERAAAEDRSIYLLGGEKDSAARAAEALRVRFPSLRIAGHASPWISAPVTEDELAPIRDELQATQPDLVYVAFGSPKQEYLIQALKADLPGTWMMGCGISLSFIAGDVARAPQWMQRVGLEWMHRLSQEPRRLFSRYLLKNLPYSFRLLWQAAQHRQ